MESHLRGRPQAISILDPLNGPEAALVFATEQERDSHPLAFLISRADAVEAQLGYSGHNVERMGYGSFRKQGLFIGSGVIVAGCRSVIIGRGAVPKRLPEIL